MPKVLKKIVISVLLVTILFASFAPYAKAADEVDPWYDQSFTQWSKKVFEEGNENEIFGERYTYAQVTWIFNSLAAMVLGTDLLKCIGVTSENIADQVQACVEKLKPVDPSQFLGSSGVNSPAVAISEVSDYLSTDSLPSGIGYVSGSLSRLHIISEAQAQGFGFSSISPLQKAWRASRNIAYALMVLVIIVIAFMIMFRVKISPQTVISIQSALPKIILTILLITFSYAIVGLIVDLSYVVIGIVAIAAKSQGLAGAFASGATIKTTADLFRVMLTAHPIGSIFLTLTIYFVIIGLLGSILAGEVSLMTGGLFLPVALGAGVIFLIMILIFGIMLIVTALRILWTKLKAFINILLLIIVGPFVLLFGAVSPAAGGFGTWLRNIIANLAVFPTLIIMGFLAHYFFWGFFEANDLLGQWFAKGSWLNPFEISPLGASDQIAINIPGFGGRPSLVGFLVALGIIFLMPSVANIIKGMIEGKPFAYGTAIGEAVTPAKGVGLYAAAQGMNIAERVAEKEGKQQTPPWVQVGRKLLGLKSQ